GPEHGDPAAEGSRLSGAGRGRRGPGPGGPGPGRKPRPGQDRGAQARRGPRAPAPDRRGVRVGRLRRLGPPPPPQEPPPPPLPLPRAPRPPAFRVFAARLTGARRAGKGRPRCGDAGIPRMAASTGLGAYPRKFLTSLDELRFHSLARSLL